MLMTAAITVNGDVLQTAVILLSLVISVLAQMLHFSKKLGVYEAKFCSLAKQIEDLKKKVEQLDSRVYELSKSIKI